MKRLLLVTPSALLLWNQEAKFKALSSGQLRELSHARRSPLAARYLPYRGSRASKVDRSRADV